MICIKAENLFSIREDARRIPLNALFPRPVSIIYGIDQRSLVGRFPKGRNHAIGTRTHRANDPLSLSALLCSIPSARHRLWLCVETESGRDCIRLNFRLEFVSHTRPGGRMEPKVLSRAKLRPCQARLAPVKFRGARERARARVLFCTPESE
jgi:hypothetical protein